MKLVDIIHCKYSVDQDEAVFLCHSWHSSLLQQPEAGNAVHAHQCSRNDH